MATQRISMCDGPFQHGYITVGGLFGQRPQALWAVRDEDGDIGCIRGQRGQPPGLGMGETVVGCYEYDDAADGYVWRPVPQLCWHPGVCRS